MLVGERLHIRLFLEGVEVPVISSILTCNPGTSAMASIQVPAVSEAFKFLPRTLVHLFYYYPTDGDKTEEDKYKLLFIGEIIGLSGNKTPMGFAVVLQCMDLSNYWESTFIFNASGLGKDGRRLSNFVGVNTTVLSSSNQGIFPGDNKSGYSQIARLLRRSPASFPTMKGLLGGIVRLLESIGGFYRGPSRYTGYNDFTSLAELRLKLMQQINAAYKDESSAKILNRKEINKWAKQTIGSRGNMQSFNDVVNNLMQFIFHQRYSILAPPYLDEGATFTRTTTTRPPTTYDVRPIIAALRRITHFRSDSYPSGYKIMVKFWQIVIWAKGQCAGYTDKLDKTDRNAQAIFAHARKKLREARNLGRTIADTLKKDRPLPKGLHRHATPLRAKAAAERAYRSEYCSRYRRFYNLIQEVIQILGPLLAGSSDGAFRPRTTTHTYEMPDRLGVHFIIPDLFFSPPPRCNVIFPDFFDRLNFSRAFLQEPTRLMLMSGSRRSGDFFGGGSSRLGAHFAPDTPAMRGATRMGSKQFARTIMPHEVYTGIIPTQHQIPWAKVYKAQAKGGRNYPYIQRLTNFEYAKQRYGSRGITVSGQFNWRPIPGFPIAVITSGMTDRYLQQFHSNQELSREAVGNHFLGYLSGLQHSLDQNGGRTDYSISMARSQWELGESFGARTKEVRRQSGTARRRFLVLEYWFDQGKRYQRYLKDGNPEMILGTPLSDGPAGSKISIIGKSASPRTGQRYWVYKTRNVVKGTGGTEVGEGFVAKPVKGKWVREVWDPDKRPYLPAALSRGGIRMVEVFGTTPTFTTDNVDVPLEAVLTPPWLDKIWHLDNIDDTYREMFHAPSILKGVGVTINPEDPINILDLELPDNDDSLSEGGKVVLRSAYKAKTTEEAVNQIVGLYTYAKRGDVFDFIKQFTDRPVATFSQIFGSPDFKVAEVEENGESRFKVVSGEEGFHSRAVGDHDNIFSMVDENVETVLRLNRKDGSLLAELDTRTEKRQKVRDYLDAILFYSFER